MADMSSKTAELLQQLQNKQANFNDVLTFINTHYEFTATAFSNGDVKNAADENQGSCRVFGFAQLSSLNVDETLSLFAEHYQHVLDTPDGDNHQNIRQFQANGWKSVKFDNTPLTLKS